MLLKAASPSTCPPDDQGSWEQNQDAYDDQKRNVEESEASLPLSRHHSEDNSLYLLQAARPWILLQ